MVMAIRMASVEHIRQEADAAGVDVTKIERKPVTAQRVTAREVAVIRQDLFRQPVEAGAIDADDDGRRVA